MTEKYPKLSLSSCQSEPPIDQNWPEVQEPRDPTTEVSQAQKRQMSLCRLLPETSPGCISQQAVHITGDPGSSRNSDPTASVSH